MALTEKDCPCQQEMAGRVSHTAGVTWVAKAAINSSAYFTVIICQLENPQTSPTWRERSMLTLRSGLRCVSVRPVVDFYKHQSLCQASRLLLLPRKIAGPWQAQWQCRQ